MRSFARVAQATSPTARGGGVSPLAGRLEEAADLALEEEALVLLRPGPSPLPVLQPQRPVAQALEQPVLHPPRDRPADGLHVEGDLEVLLEHIHPEGPALLVPLHPELPAEAARQAAEVVEAHHDLVVEARRLELVHLEAVGVVAGRLPDRRHGHSVRLVLEIEGADDVEQLLQWYAVLWWRAVEDLVEG